jgi:hypothetical protein
MWNGPLLDLITASSLRYEAMDIDVVENKQHAYTRMEVSVHV